ncbi:MAG: hypothetical protein AAB250_19640 [Bdellovibrionota bacterium]
MKALFFTVAMTMSLTLTQTAQAAAANVPEVFTLGRDLCVTTARTQLLDACDFHAEVKTRKSSKWGMALEICGTYGESNPAREANCYARAVNLIKDEDTLAQAMKCRDLSIPGEKNSCLKKVFASKNGEKVMTKF